MEMLHDAHRGSRLKHVNVEVGRDDFADIASARPLHVLLVLFFVFPREVIPQEVIPQGVITKEINIQEVIT